MKHKSALISFSVLLSVLISCSADVYINKNRNISGYRSYTAGELTGAPQELQADIHAEVTDFLESTGLKRVDGTRVNSLPIDELASLIYYNIDIKSITDSEISLHFSLEDAAGVTVLSKSSFMRRSYSGKLQMLKEALEDVFASTEGLLSASGKTAANKNNRILKELLSGRQKSEFSRDSLASTDPDFYNQTENIEGWWYLPAWQYKILIAAKPGSLNSYIGIVTESSTPLWSENDLKCEIRSTLSLDLFEVKLYDNLNSVKQYTGRINKDGFRLSLLDSKGEVVNELIKTFPGNDSLNYYSYSNKTPRSTLSGVLINRSGLIVCSSYETGKKDFVKVMLRSGSRPADAEIIINSSKENLMLVKINDFDYEEYYSFDPPYYLTDDKYTDEKEAVIITTSLRNKTIRYNLYDCRVSGRSENGFEIDNLSGTDLNLIDHPVFTSAGEFIGFIYMSKNEHTYHRLTAERNNLNEIIKMTGNVEEIFNSKSWQDDTTELYREIKEYVLPVMIYEGR